MLAELHAKNFALFENIEIEFSDRMNVITGESGSGKSLFLSILKVLLGERSEFITDKSEIEALFVINNEEFIVNLKISPTRMRAKLNGSMITLAELKDHVGMWMDIHTQGVSQILRDPKTHTNFVDVFSSSIEPYLQKYKKNYVEYSNISRFIRDNGSIDIEETLEDISKEIEKIEKNLITDDEYNELKEAYKKQSNIGDILKISREIEYLISGDNGMESLSLSILKSLKEMERMDHNKSFLKMEREMEESIDFLKRSMADYANSLEFDQEKVLALEDHISEIEKLKRKYGSSLESVKNALDELNKKYERLNSMNLELKNARKNLAIVTKAMEDLSAVIKQMRKDASEELIKRINENLKDLSMSNSRISFVQHETEFTESGTDQIELVGSMNVGMPETSISKIASGGEISRLYLAIESSINGKLPVSTLIFDEIETGIGPRTSDVVADKMKEISQNTQIIVITHMPQIAAVADRHFKVEKHQLSDTTYSTVIQIDGEERRTEIKEMFGKMSVE